MLDHAFLDAVGAIRHTLHEALLERHAVEETLQVDVLLGDVTWETSYALPGEGVEPRVLAELTVGWSTWSQTAYRSWATGLSEDEPPAVDLELVVRVNRLAERLDPDMLTTTCPDPGPTLGDEPLSRSLPTIEEQLTHEGSRFAAEVEYSGSVFLDERTLEDGERLAATFASLGPWLASTLVRVGDLDVKYLPPTPEEP